MGIITNLYTNFTTSACTHAQLTPSLPPSHTHTQTHIQSSLCFLVQFPSLYSEGIGKMTNIRCCVGVAETIAIIRAVTRQKQENIVTLHSSSTGTKIPYVMKLATAYGTSNSLQHISNIHLYTRPAS